MPIFQFTFREEATEVKHKVYDQDEIEEALEIAINEAFSGFQFTRDELILVERLPEDD